MKWAWVGVILVLVATNGCRRSNAVPLFPLETGASWTYEVTDGLQRNVSDLKVGGPAPVGPYQGFELSGSAGPARLAWHGDQLFAAEMSGIRFDPPLPLISQDGTAWNGRCIWAGKSSDAQATVSRETVEEMHLGQKRRITLVTHQLVLGEGEATRELILESRYVPGSGLIRQDLLQDGRMLRRITLLSR
ncbi:MAG: hypothetical protein KF812_02945 [Fimbriimonadaceae bacterium]|nr:hypothetical protein [Fimbriimonadaceae bacterium]